MIKAEKKLTGWHVFAIFGGAFGVIIAVNLFLAFSAVRTFPGLETSNSYVASQTFDDRRAAQEALGWTVSAQQVEDELRLSITKPDGTPVQVGKLEATVGRPTHVKDDLTPDFQFDGRSYVALETLAAGNWNIRMKATALDGTVFEQRVVFTVKD